MKPYAYKITLAALEEWAKSNPQPLQRLCKYFKQVCEIRSKSDNEKVKMSDKYTTSPVTGYPDKYKKSNRREGYEVYIVEGDSAGGSGENNRDKEWQAIFPIRGKMKNAFTTATSKYFANEEVAGLFKVCGYDGYSRKFDPAKFKPSKIVMCTDADADGDHIAGLILGLFLRYLPFVIEQGMLYRVVPPLYSITKGKDTIYFNDRIEYIEYVQDSFCKSNKVINVNNNRAYSKHDLTQIIYKYMDYYKEMNHIADTYSIHPLYLEFVLMNKDLPINKLKTSLKKQFGFTDINKINDTAMIEVLYNSKIQTIFLNDRFVNECKDAINYLSKANNFYNVNGQIITLYGLLSLFKSFEPKNISRYKGLGEMPPKELGKTTIIPGQGRLLRQYTLEDAKKELQYITSLQSDKSAFVKGIKVKKEDIA